MDKTSLLSAAFPDADPDSPSAYYGSMGDLYQALAFSDLFWPTCFVVEGAVFVQVGATSPGWVAEGLQLFVDGDGGDRSWPEFVDSFNWFEVPYLFGQLRNPMDRLDEASVELARVLRECWSARLAGLFPDRVFEIQVNDRGPEALNVSISQVSPPLVEPNVD